ncbi:Glutamate receptor delta-2 subunit [Ooceraea biroi]|uniref:Glutamate receptor delta-2 subunit n=1 Tax=Ooceraea biroi TaxID=2015173 RepID=A0A026WII0_OOCBI|nr:Glutamate receptor delta-2 subunit [Ooceraea biroi]
MKILQQYTAHGNVAFSPTGVAFVLAALYEGSAGRGNKQIAKAMNLPLNRDITRIGFRDIHRRLRSYLNADGFLGGLTLSRENTKLRSEYEDILRFYGFDLSNSETSSSTITMIVLANDQSLQMTSIVTDNISDTGTTGNEGIWMQNLKIWKSYGTKSSESSTGDTTAEISFLVNGCDVSSVSASRYIAVLPFAYFPSLHAVALEFPLDDPRYNIILLMPTDKTDVHHLARDLNGKSLRLLRKRLQSTWVKATIPSFMLRGFVTLTSFLQRLGILDVFDPNTADLSPMTSDLGVYARDIQQSIGINIRNYMKPDRTHSRNGLFERAEPVPFTALHPFLYFIIDTETSVSLIAGRIDDPLNSRIL